MGRKYAVWIGGKPVVIQQEVPERAVREHWLVLNAHDAQEVDRAISAIARPEVHGVLLFTSQDFDIWEAFSERYRFVQAAGGAVQDEQGRLLVIRRLGLWDLPKGKVDKGEAIDDASIREVQEECGLQSLKIVRPLEVTWHTYERKGIQHLKRTDWFLMRGSSNETLAPQLDEDITEARWIAHAELSAVRQGTYPSLWAVLDAWEAAQR
ncbi:MAG: NUDIX domain-containing protein [Flavobacteriales bacterium]|nr:NUDIX domain-containing protein [Flavobacteriales bacterium]